MTIEEDLQFIEDAVKKLRRDYDLFFSGAAKLPPFKLRMEADRKAMEISRIKLDKLAMRFKVQAVMSKYSSSVTLWEKQMKLRESGIRDPRLAAAVAVGRKEIHNLELGRLTPEPEPPPIAAVPPLPGPGKLAPEKAAAAAPGAPADVLGARLRKTTPSMPAVKVPAAAPAAPALPPAAPPKPEAGNATLRSLFDEYNQLRQQAGEKPTADLDKFAAMIDKKKAELAQKGSKNVAFGVALKDGRVILKAKTGSG